MAACMTSCFQYRRVPSSIPAGGLRPQWRPLYSRSEMSFPKRRGSPLKTIAASSPSLFSAAWPWENHIKEISIKHGFFFSSTELHFGACVSLLLHEGALWFLPSLQLGQGETQAHAGPDQRVGTPRRAWSSGTCDVIVGVFPGDPIEDTVAI